MTYLYYTLCFILGFFLEDLVIRSYKWVKSTHVLFRPIYAIYRLLFKIKYPRTIADGKKRLEKPLSFNEWVIRKGLFPKDWEVHELNIIVPKSYSEFVKKYPNGSFISMDEKGIKSYNWIVSQNNTNPDEDAKNFYHWVE